MPFLLAGNEPPVLKTVAGIFAVVLPISCFLQVTAQAMLFLFADERFLFTALSKQSWR